MSIDWTHFTPLSALIGGFLIGVAAAALVLVSGRIAGVSGIIGGLLQLKAGDTGWRAAFLAGLVAAPLLYQLFTALPEIHVEAGWPTLILAGVLVGVGTRYGSGCTSGHAVCGLSRLSPRSLMATLAFMGTGFVTVYLVRHVLAG
jgi:hypothetical protein